MKLTAKARKDVNGKLADLCRNRLPHIPLADINGFLSPHGMRLEEVILCGREGHTKLDLLAGDAEVTNSMLVLHWLRGEVTNDYEITAYLS